MEKSKAPLIAIAIILLLVANFSYWLSKTLYNPNNFSKIIVQTYEQQEVRNALASEIVDKNLESKPLVSQVIGDPVKSAISGILGSQVFKSVLERVATRFQSYLTTNNREDVTIEVGQVATFIKAAATTISPELGAQVPDVTTQTVTLINKDSLPNINRWAKPIMTLGPIAGLIGIVLLIYLIYTSSIKGHVLKKIGLYLLIGTIVFALAIPYFKTVLQGNISSQNAQIIATATYDAFASILATQLSYLAIASGIIYFIGFYLINKEGETFDDDK